jgi:hypothetical protein
MRLEFISAKPARGQMLSFDVLIASALLVIILAVLVAKVGYSIKDSQELTEKTSMISDCDKLSNIFFEEGLPKNWTRENVQIIGLESSGRINLTKLSSFNQTSFYQNSLILLGISSDYNITIYSSGYNASFGIPYENATSIVKKDRIGVLENGSLVTIRILTFRK